MTTMMEALADHYNVKQQTLREIMEATPNTNSKVPYGTSVPSKRQNKIRSGRASRRAARNQQALQAVGGVAGHWTRAAMKPADYNMCRIKEATPREGGVA